MKSKAAKIIDKVVLSIAVWLFTALVARYYVSRIFSVVVCASVVTLGVLLLLRYKGKAYAEVEKNSYKAAICAAHFLYRDYEYALSYFLEAFRARYPQAEQKKFFIRINDTVVVPALGEPLNLKNAVYYYSEALRENAKTLVILTPLTDKSVEGASDRLTDLRLEIFDKDKTYKLLESLGKIPDQAAPPPSKLRGFVATALSPKRSKSYLLTSLVFIFGAYFSLFSLYFIIMAALSLTLAFVCRLNVFSRFSSGG